MSARSPSSPYWAAIYPLAALAALVASAGGSFRSRTTFPLIFGLLWALAALVELWLRRRQPGRRARAVLCSLGALLALAAPVAHGVRMVKDSARLEAAALAELGGRPAPPLVFDFALDGGRAHAGEQLEGPIELAGRPALINFWATWCAPCVKELPALKEFARRHGDELEMIGVTRLYGGQLEGDAAEREVAAIRSFLQARDVSYRNLIEKRDSLHRAYRAQSLPTTVLVGRDGNVLDYGIGLRGSKRLMGRADELLD